MAGVFLFAKSFFVLEIFTFFIKSDDFIGGSTETAHHSIENNFRKIREVFFTLGTSNEHHKRNIMKPIVPLS